MCATGACGLAESCIQAIAFRRSHLEFGALLVEIALRNAQSLPCSGDVLRVLVSRDRIPAESPGVHETPQASRPSTPWSGELTARFPLRGRASHVMHPDELEGP